jgi:uncharacterized protein YqeY
VLTKRIRDDLKAAMKAGETERVMTLRGVLTEVTRLEKEVIRQATDDDVVGIIKRERARREEALEFARKAGRAELVEQNEREAAILAAYLPAAASADELRTAIAEAIAAGTTQMGPLMKAMRDRFGTRLDGKLASDLARQALASR